MKSYMNFSKWSIIYGVALIVFGVLLGWFFFGAEERPPQIMAESEHNHAQESTTWTCSMHPQIQREKPGQCPICGMELIPLSDGGGGSWELMPNEIPMTEEAMKLAEIQTAIVTKEKPEKEIHLLGKVKADERNISELTARFGGRIEKLYINFTGQKVSKGQRLASIYSPALITAQKELFEAIKYKESNPNFYQAARNKLKLWDLTDDQIAKIEQDGTPEFYFDVLAPIGGIVTNRHVSLGDYVKEGNALFEVTDLSKIWVMFEAYESDIPWIKIGDKISFNIQSIPGKEFETKVTYIDPFINPQNRVVYVRVELNNPESKLKPDMFANGVVLARLPIDKPVLMIPKSSVLWTGKRGVVYVKTPHEEHNSFTYREIVLGEDAGEFYVVEKGLNEGEVIATNGVFKIDAAAQLAGKKSMMNPEGGKVSMGHNHGGSSGEKAENKTSAEDHSGHDIKVEPRNIDKKEVPQRFKEQLGKVAGAYLELKNAFVASSSDEVKMKSKDVKMALDKVDMKLVRGEAHNAWMEAVSLIDKSLVGFSESNDIEEQRKNFGELSGYLSHTFQVLGVRMKNEQMLYLQYCPMADGNKGAYWMSTDKEIKNPYFGEAMISCGETKDSIPTKN